MLKQLARARRMTDIFVSYKSEDRERVRPIVTALKAAQFSVWWDEQIAGGSAWRLEIQQALDAARCVIVVWSRRSVAAEGQFVHDEAARAQKRGVYLPICIDAVDPPLGFGEVQIHSLIGWKGKVDDPAMTELIAAARATAAGHRRPSEATRRPGRLDRRMVIGGGIAAAATAAAGGGIFLWQRSAAASAGDSLAVLPFANLSGDPGQAYFADGMAEE